MTYQEIEIKYSYLLTWDQAGVIAGYPLDYNNYFDCCLYHDLLLNEIKKHNINID